MRSHRSRSTNLCIRNTVATSFLALSRIMELCIKPLASVSIGLSFVSSRLRHDFRESDIYIASYPRSGTTLMQMAVHQLLHPGDISFDHISQVVPYIDRCLALGREPSNNAGRRIFKTHLTPLWIGNNRSKYIYIHRNIDDVAWSYYNFYVSHHGFNGSLEAFINMFVGGKAQSGSWVKHVSRWFTYAERGNVLVISYDDVITDPRRALRGVARFCEIEVDEQTLDVAAEAISFEAMKSLETKFDHINEILIERRMQQGMFIRSGLSGSGRAQLTADIRAKLAREAAKASAPSYSA